MNRILVVLLICVAKQTIACTIFTATDGKSVFVGNNEDYSPTATSYLWIRPQLNAHNGYIFWGFKAKFPEGGMNDKGLFIDAAALPNEIPITRAADKTDFEGYLIEKILQECTNVDDVVRLVEKYNLTWQQKAQIMVVDKSGDYAIIHANYILRKSSPSFVLTNFRMDPSANHDFTCWRRNTAIAELATRKVSAELFRNILSKTAQTQPDNATIYSQVCNLNEGIIYLYQNQNFNQARKISIKTILKKGKKDIRINSLFPQSIGAIVERSINKSGIAEAFKIYSELKKSSSKSTYDFSEKELDELGYKLLNGSRIREAIAVFELNRQSFPNSANAVAGLANAYQIKGDVSRSSSLYRKAFAIDTANVYTGIFCPGNAGFLTFRLNGLGNAKNIRIYLKNIRSQVTTDTTLVWTSDDRWLANIRLLPGEYSYSYKVDDSWMVDPGNKLTTKSGNYINSYLIVR